MSPAEPSVFDGHNDCLLRLPTDRPATAFLDGRDDGHLDAPRAETSSFTGGLFALFVEPSPDTTDRERRRVETPDGFKLDPPPALRPQYAKQQTNMLLDRLDAVLDAAGDELILATDVPTLRRSVENDDQLACVLHFEGAPMIEPDCSNLQAYYDRGLRSLGLVWSRPNQFAHGVPFEFPGDPDTGPGLTAHGKRLVQECNELGIVVDLAHLNEQGFWDVAELSTDPLVVSHAGVHEICPSTRNLTDEQLRAVADSDGIIGITFALSAIRPDGRRDPDTAVDQIADHVEYVADLIGVDHVAIGSDFDGAAIPESVGDVTGLSSLLSALDRRGFDQEARKKMAHENWVRVLDATWAE